jgi:hypothetical protein
LSRWLGDFSEAEDKDFLEFAKGFAAKNSELSQFRAAGLRGRRLLSDALEDLGIPSFVPSEEFFDEYEFSQVIPVVARCLWRFTTHAKAEMIWNSVDRHMIDGYRFIGAACWPPEIALSLIPLARLKKSVGKADRAIQKLRDALKEAKLSQHSAVSIALGNQKDNAAALRNAFSNDDPVPTVDDFLLALRNLVLGAPHRAKRFGPVNDKQDIRAYCEFLEAFFRKQTKLPLRRLTVACAQVAFGSIKLTERTLKKQSRLKQG